MDINGTIIVRFNTVKDRVYWNGSLQVKGKDGSIWVSVPLTFSKDGEEKVKKLFSEKTKKSDKDRHITLNVTKGFISGYKDKENKSVLKLVLLDFDLYTPTKEDESNKHMVKTPF